MWDDLPSDGQKAVSDVDINSKYAKRELRIVTETNREQLPNFVAALQRPNWMKLQPFYQRRRRWDNDRKSKLIESFIMNVPVPPCFLFESDFARYEVMDGQQRISAIWDFYENRFELSGLEQWPELNGRIYDKLPSEIKKGLDRRSISYIVLLKESAASSDEELLLRQQVFERLNTGGIELENQEIRHCIYHNEFDKALIELAKHPVMRKAWGLPEFTPEEEVNPNDILLENSHFSKMKDVEFILRFFALRHAERYRGGMQPFLDQYMVRSRRFRDSDVRELKELFRQTLELADAVFEEHVFRPWMPKKNQWAPKPQIAYGDATMVAMSRFLDRKQTLIDRRGLVLKAAQNLVESEESGTFTGQKNTKESVLARISAFANMLQGVVDQP